MDEPELVRREVSLYHRLENVKVRVEWKYAASSWRTHAVAIAALRRLTPTGVLWLPIPAIHAFDFLRQRRDELFPGVPVVFCGVNYRR